jgi:hypothetical protein
VIEGFGRDDLRTLAFDCTQSWIHPDRGDSAGWYVLHRQTVTNENPFIQQRLAPARLSFEQLKPYETPPLSVYEWDPITTTPPQGADPIWAAPVEWPPAQVTTEGAPVAAPVWFDGPLDFEGYEFSQDGRTVILVTYWRAKEHADRPLSLMAHLVNAEGHPIAVGDGLGVAFEQLQPGDLVIQRHVLPVPEDLVPGRYWLQTGAYWLDTMTRFPILSEGERAGDRLLLSPVDIE